MPSSGFQQQPLVCAGMQNLHPTKRRFLLLRATFHVFSLPLHSPPFLAVSGVSASLCDPQQQVTELGVGRRLLCLLSAVQTRLCNPPTPERLWLQICLPNFFWSCFLSSIITHPCSPQCFPPPPLSCTWLFFLARLLLSVMPLTLINAPTLYLFSSSLISLHCFVVPVPFSILLLFLAILKNCNGTVTASPEQNEIHFA